MLTTLITEMYGGKIDDEADFQALASLVTSIMTPAAFEDNFKIVKDMEQGPGLELPASTGWKDFMGWVNELPEREPPTYLGLPANAERILLVGQAGRVLGNLGVVLGMLEEGERLGEVEEIET